MFEGEGTAASDYVLTSSVSDTAGGEMSCFSKYQDDENKFREALGILVDPFRQRSWQQGP